MRPAGGEGLSQSEAIRSLRLMHGLACRRLYTKPRGERPGAGRASARGRAKARQGPSRWIVAQF
jgi:hypothetical protein